MANINCDHCIANKAHPKLRSGLAALLALACPVGVEGKTPDPVGPARVNADPTFPFSNEIAAFAKADAAGPALSNAVLFLGSSSIRLWNTGASFPARNVINRGFGGATTNDVLQHYPRLLPRAKPSSVLVYVGENDLAGGASTDTVSRDVLSLIRRLRASYPAARIAYLSLKPSPIRWTLWPKMAAVNMTVAARSRAAGFDYLDVAASLLANDGLPDASLFTRDGLHMNARGYQRWTKLVQDWLQSSSSPPPAQNRPLRERVDRISSLSD